MLKSADITVLIVRLTVALFQVRTRSQHDDVCVGRGRHQLVTVLLLLLTRLQTVQASRPITNHNYNYYYIVSMSAGAITTTATD